MPKKLSIPAKRGLHFDLHRSFSGAMDSSCVTERSRDVTPAHARGSRHLRQRTLIVPDGCSFKAHVPDMSLAAYTVNISQTVHVKIFTVPIGKHYYRYYIQVKDEFTPTLKLNYSCESQWCRMANTLVDIAGE